MVDVRVGDVAADLEQTVETERVAIDLRRQAARFGYIKLQIVDVAVQDVHARVLRRHRMAFSDAKSQSWFVALVRLRT